VLDTAALSFYISCGGHYIVDAAKFLYSQAMTKLPAAEETFASVIEPGRSGKPKLQIFSSEKTFEHRILVAGCDPALSVLARYAQTAGIGLVLAHRKINTLEQHR